MESILKAREMELSKRLFDLRLDAVGQVLSLLDSEQQELWRSR